ncbi:MAG: hypothetical protein QXR48_04310 [Candidatus Woesearchaeota archaeon]
MGDDIDANTAEKISNLAKNLKELHLASSAEEAYARAKEIILGTRAEGQEKSIRELMQESGITQQDLDEAKALLKQEEEELNKLKKEITELKARQIEESMHHAEHSAETEKLDKSLVEQEHDVGVLEENIEVAEEVQKEKKENQQEGK